MRYHIAVEPVCKDWRKGKLKINVEKSKEVMRSCKAKATDRSKEVGRFGVSVQKKYEIGAPGNLGTGNS